MNEERTFTVSILALQVVSIISLPLKQLGYNAFNAALKFASGMVTYCALAVFKPIKKKSSSKIFFMLEYKYNKICLYYSHKKSGHLRIRIQYINWLVYF